MRYPKKKERKLLSAEERKYTLFVRGFKGQDIVPFLEQRLGITMNRKGRGGRHTPLPVAAKKK